MEDAKPLLRMEHVKKSFGSNQVLKDISFNVNEGEVFAIIGPSGGGKSTLLRCATLLETIDSGTLAYEDVVVCQNNGGDETVYGSKKTLAQAKRKFGLVFQNFNLFPHMNVLENVMDAPVRVLKKPKDEVERHARELIKKMGLEGKEGMVPCELSGGQQQRVAIARALAMDPDVLFFDEPTSALDPEVTQEVLKVIRNLAAEHMTMVIVTHEMIFARDVADYLVFMDGGHIVEQGLAKDVINNPQHSRTKAFLSRLSD